MSVLSTAGDKGSEEPHSIGSFLCPLTLLTHLLRVPLDGKDRKGLVFYCLNYTIMCPLGDSTVSGYPLDCLMMSAVDNDLFSIQTS